MGSESKQVLPSINFSETLTPGSPGWNSVKRQVHEALVKYGCFEACLEKVDLELRKSTRNAVEELFDLPLEAKRKNSSKKPYHGYLGQYPFQPLYESMGIQDPTSLHKVQTFTHLFWPQGNSIFCKAIQSFSKELSEIDEMVRKMVLESLGVEKYFDEHISSTDYLLRVMKYTAPETTADTMAGILPHADKNIVSVLYQDNVSGLQVKTREGDWINVKPSPASFIVMIGDAFNAWTNGRLHSPYHQVMMRGSEERYSIGLFSIPKAGYIIKAPEELVDEEYPLLFKPYDHLEYLAFHSSKAGQNADQSTLVAYCGVNSSASF